eukprot:TRINITY_DN1187_c0_g1_i2.p1 TRINITY_DN1187_c0_g1~~TRINITY_DN1187_c0_g1_i2.p1  ORF type:complete len:563 (-),score=80.94 TRINITY_DN1187_c0_g1_i2:43-1731(-)
MMIGRGCGHGVLFVSRSFVNGLVKKNKFHPPPLSRIHCPQSPSFSSIKTFELIKRHNHTDARDGDPNEVKLTAYDENIIKLCRENNLQDAFGFFKISPSLNSAMALVLTYREKGNYYSVEKVMEVIICLVEEKIEMDNDLLFQAFYLFDELKPKKAIDLLDLTVKMGIQLDEACISKASSSIKERVHHGYAKMFVEQIVSGQHDFLPHPNVCSNFMYVFGFYENFELALLLLAYMMLKEIKVDHGCLINLIKSCGTGPSSFEKVKKVHLLLPSELIQNQSVISILMQTYAKCGGIDHAIKVFEDCVKPTLFTYNRIIDLCATNDRVENAFEYFERLQQKYDIQPDLATYISVISAVTNGGSRYLSIGEKLYKEITADMKLDTAMVVGALMNMFNKCDHPEKALKIFDNYEKRNDLNDIILNFGLSACVLRGPDSFEKGKEMHQKVIDLDLLTHPLLSTTLMAMYYKCGDHNELFRIYEELRTNHNFSLNSEKAKLLIQACASSKSLQMGKKIHQQIKPKTFYNKEIENELISMYIECGDMVSAKILKQQSQKPLPQNIRGTL